MERFNPNFEITLTGEIEFLTTLKQIFQQMYSNYPDILIQFSEVEIFNILPQLPVIQYNNITLNRKKLNSNSEVYKLSIKFHININFITKHEKKTLKQHEIQPPPPPPISNSSNIWNQFLNSKINSPSNSSLNPSFILYKDIIQKVIKYNPNNPNNLNNATTINFFDINHKHIDEKYNNTYTIIWSEDYLTYYNNSNSYENNTNNNTNNNNNNEILKLNQDFKQFFNNFYKDNLKLFIFNLSKFTN